jgi:hypothetical protein
MKFTVPDMDTLNDTGFQIFKPYGDSWCLVKGPDEEGGPHGICILGECVPFIICPNMMDVHQP